MLSTMPMSLYYEAGTPSGEFLVVELIEINTRPEK